MPTTTATNRNDRFHDLLRDATGVECVWTADAKANPFGWLHLPAPDLLKKAAKALAGKVRLCTVTAYAEERDDENKRRRIAYHFASGDTVITVTVPLYDQETLKKLPVPSITPWFRNADWNEREFREMFAIEIEGHPNPNRLFLDPRLDAGIMTKLIPFSAMANGAASNTLWERVLEAKGVPPEDRLPSLAVPPEPIKVAPKVTPVAPAAKAEGAATLANVAAPAEAIGASDVKPAAEAAGDAPEKAPAKVAEKNSQTAAPAAEAQAQPKAAPVAEPHSKPAAPASATAQKEEAAPAKNATGKAAQKTPAAAAAPATEATPKAAQAAAPATTSEAKPEAASTAEPEVAFAAASGATPAPQAAPAEAKTPAAAPKAAPKAAAKPAAPKGKKTAQGKKKAAKKK